MQYIYTRVVPAPRGTTGSIWPPHFYVVSSLTTAEFCRQ